MNDDRNKEILNALVAAVSCPDCNVLVGTDTETGETRILHGSECPSLGAEKQRLGIANDQPVPGSVIINFGNNNPEDGENQ